MPVELIFKSGLEGVLNVNSIEIYFLINENHSISSQFVHA